MSQTQDDSWRFPMPLMCSAFESGMLDYTLAQMPKDGFGAIAHAEAFYYRGLPDDACRLAEPYLTSEDLSLRLSACLICAYANLSLNRSVAARRCLRHLEETGKDPRVTENPRARASYMLFAASACVLLIFPLRYRGRNSTHMPRCFPRACACLRRMRWRIAPTLRAITGAAWAWPKTPCR